jgi:hypothetical protein
LLEKGGGTLVRVSTRALTRALRRAIAGPIAVGVVVVVGAIPAVHVGAAASGSGSAPRTDEVARMVLPLAAYGDAGAGLDIDVVHSGLQRFDDFLAHYALAGTNAAKLPRTLGYRLAYSNLCASSTTDFYRVSSTVNVLASTRAARQLVNALADQTQARRHGFPALLGAKPTSIHAFMVNDVGSLAHGVRYAVDDGVETEYVTDVNFAVGSIVGSLELVSLGSVDLRAGAAALAQGFADRITGVAAGVITDPPVAVPEFDRTKADTSAAAIGLTADDFTKDWTAASSTDLDPFVSDAHSNGAGAAASKKFSFDGTAESLAVVEPTDVSASCAYTSLVEGFTSDDALTQYASSAGQAFAQQGLTVTGVDRGGAQFPTIGDASAFLPITVHLTGGTIANVYEDHLVIQHGRISVLMIFQRSTTPFDPSLELDLAQKVLSRMTAAS